MSDDLITLSIDNKEFKYWTSIKFNLDIDTFDRFEFDSPFDPENSELIEFFEPMSFKPVEIKIDGVRFLKGVLVNINPKLDTSNFVTCSGYSLPGILNDVNIPLEKYPIEFNNQSLEQIAKSIAGIFNIDVKFSGKIPGKSEAIFDQVALETGQKPLDFLIPLAKKRGFLITNDSDGNLLFHKAITTGRQTDLKEGYTPLTSIEPSFDPQNYYSSITALIPGMFGRDFESVTIKNPFFDSDSRPFVYSENEDLDDADIKQAVNWKMGLMFGDAIKYVIDCQGLRNQYDEIWKPNMFVNVFAPSVMIYRETRFLIKSVELERSTGNKSKLSVVLPESYSGKIPEKLPWTN